MREHTDPAKKLHQPPTDPPLLCSFFIPGNFGFLPLNLEKRRNSGNRDTLSLSVPKRNRTLCFSSSGHHWTAPAVCFAHHPDKPLNDATRINLQLRRRAVTGAQTQTDSPQQQTSAVVFVVRARVCLCVCLFAFSEVCHCPRSEEQHCLQCKWIKVRSALLHHARV